MNLIMRVKLILTQLLTVLKHKGIVSSPLFLTCVLHYIFVVTQTHKPLTLLHTLVLY